MARPGVGDGDPLELRDAVDEQRPDALLPVLLPDPEVAGVDLEVRVGGHSGDEVGRVGAEVQARGVDGEREQVALELLAAVEDEHRADPWFHGQRQASHFGDPAAPWSGAVHDPPAADGDARGELDVGDQVVVEAQSHDPVGQVLDAVSSGPASEALEQGVGVDVPLVSEAEAGAGQVVDVEVWKPGEEFVGREQRNLGTAGALHLVVLAQRRHAAFGGEEQVSGVPEAEVGRFAVDLDVFVEVGDELGGEL